MAKDPMNNYYIFRKTVENMLYFIGHYPRKGASKFYRFIPYINILFHAYCGFGIFYFIKLHINNLVLVISVLGILITHMVSTVKIICLLMNRDEMIELIEISDAYFNYVKNSPRMTDLIKDLSTFYYMFWVLTISCITICIAGNGPPLLYFIIDKIKHVERPSYALTYKVAYPWTVQFDGFNYVLHWMNQTYAAISASTLTCSVQGVFSILVFRMISELRDMSHHHTKLEKSGEESNVISYCTDKYTMLMKYGESIQDIFGLIILQMFISNAVQLCACMFLLTKVTINTYVIVYVTAFIFIKIMESCLCALAGSYLITESEDYKHAVYCINWRGNKQLMNWVLVTIIQRPLTLIACHYTTISLNVIVSIVNTTISYYFLLETLQEK